MPRIAEATEGLRSRADRGGDARIFREEPFDLGPRDREAAHVGPCPYSGSALDGLAEQRALAEDVAGS